MKHLQRFLETLGAAGVLALGVLLFCVPVYLTAVKPAERELEAQRGAADRLKNRSPYQTVSITGNGAPAELFRFQSLFPPVEQLSDELEKLYSLGRKAKLDLQQGEYRLENRGPGLAAYRVTLPIRGAYPQIREFVGAILQEMPIASVDALRFERKRVAEAQLEAQVRLTIHFRAPAETDAP
ncbi:MAG: hypothetical protein A3F74_27220 [Betaproteobacteria bacterium RIFCSPLOWO2_12_FULL_62_58]|nr:MAG: hypothetical protein A3F74_27220 [Betaproteobacteria bacterium RIFCSPLOWO2_12_FULL_62_58]